MSAFDKLMEAEEWLDKLKRMKQDAIVMVGASHDLIGTFDNAIEITEEFVAELESEADKESDEETKALNRQFERMVF